MPVLPFWDWLLEQEQTRPRPTFLLEWLSVFALALPFWILVLYELNGQHWSLAYAAALSSLYGSAFVYVRLLQQARCRKCHTPLVLSQQLLGRRYVNELEKCLEIERGGEEWYGHFLDLYARSYRVEIVRYRCRRCNAVWEQRTEFPAGDYQLIRTIEVKD